MALIGGTMQPAQHPAAQQPAPTPAPGAQGGDPVQRIVTAALLLLNQDQVEQHVLELIKGSQDPAQGLAQALVFILRTLKEKSNGMPMQALGQASQKILAEILKMAEAAKIIQITPQLLQQAVQAVKAALSPQQAAPAAQPAPTAPQAAAAQPQGV